MCSFCTEEAAITHKHSPHANRNNELTSNTLPSNKQSLLTSGSYRHLPPHQSSQSPTIIHITISQHTPLHCYPLHHFLPKSTPLISMPTISTTIHKSPPTNVHYIQTICTPLFTITFTNQNLTKVDKRHDNIYMSSQKAASNLHIILSLPSKHYSQTFHQTQTLISNILHNTTTIM